MAEDRESAWDQGQTTRWQMVDPNANRVAQGLGVPQAPNMAGNFYGTPVERRYQAPGTEFSWAMSKTPDQRMVLQNRMMRLGMYPEGASIVPSMWSPTDAGAIRKVMDFADANGLGVNEALKVMEATGQAPGSTGGGASAGPQVSTSTSTSTNSSSSKSYNITGKDTARELLRNVLQDQLGRAPSAGETRQFLRRLNRAERADPSTSSSSGSSTSTSRSVSMPGSSHTDSTSSSTSSSVSHSSKVNPQAMAERVGRQIDPAERNAYQRVLYMDVLSSMLGE